MNTSAGRSVLDPSAPVPSSSASSRSRRRHHPDYLHNNFHLHGTRAGPPGGGGAVGLPVPSALGARLTQLMDEADHRDCSEGNKKALVAETLDRLRELTKEIEEDDWMYDKKSGDGGASSGLGGDYWSGR